MSLTEIWEHSDIVTTKSNQGYTISQVVKNKPDALHLEVKAPGILLIILYDTEKLYTH